MERFLSHTLLWVLVCLLGGSVPAARTVEFETTQVTAADVALSPDGQWLIFTMLGHLFRLPVAGGTAEQLTFGPYYDTEPAISPDGSRVAFVSDRDDSEGNVFILEVATGQITQITRESSAGRPTWTPNGKAVVYLRFMAPARDSPQPWKFGQPTPPALVCQVALRGGKPDTLTSPPRLLRSVFHLPDGRLAWTVIEPGSSPWWLSSKHATTRIEVMSLEGAISTLREVPGYVDPVFPSPSAGGFYCRRSPRFWASPRPFPDELLFLPLPEGEEKRVLTLSRHRGWTPRFAVEPGNESLYLGEAGRLWKVAIPTGSRIPISFIARVRLEIRDPVTPPKRILTTGSSRSVRSVMFPVLSPDEQTLVFGAAGFLWEQPLDGGPARQLFESNGFDEWPAFSPDGRHLAFVHDEPGNEREIRMLDLESRQVRTVASGFWPPSWSQDGKQLVFGGYEGGTYRVVMLNLSDGREKQLIEFDTWRSPRPHFSPDGKALYYSDSTASSTGKGGFYRLSLEASVPPKAVTELEHRLSEGLVSPDGKWLAFRRNMEIWVAPRNKEPVREEHIRQLSLQGGDTFSFTPDGSAALYSSGNRVWRQPLTSGRREEIPIQLELPRAIPSPLLVRRLRVLDFMSGGFGPEISLFVEQNRIRWIGTEPEYGVPPETVILDAGGRFAIPGLFDLHAHRERFFGGEEEYLAYGVTSVRTVGGALAWSSAAADRGDATGDPVPRYFYSGESFRQFGRFPEWLGIHSEEEARTYVRRWKIRGAHQVKIYNTTSWPLQHAVADEAHLQGLPIVAHGTTVQEITKNVTLGITVLEHTSGPAQVYDDVLQMLAAAGTRWDPTLVTSGKRLIAVDEPERFADTKFRAFHPDLAVPTPSVDIQALRKYWVEQLAGIRAAHRRGVKLQAGTDGIAPSLHWELEHFVQAGLSPLEVLRIATQEAAAAVGADDHLGTLEPGKLADIVLLDKNPLEDIRNTQTIWRVIKGGWLFDPDELRPPESVKG